MQTIKNRELSSQPLSLVVFGASGDLAQKKVIPSLFALYSQGYLPERFCLVGYARSPLQDAEFRKQVAQWVTCRYQPRESCPERVQEFLAHCVYCQGAYDQAESFARLASLLQSREGPEPANRLFYLATPPFLFVGVARALSAAGLLAQPGDSRWSRVVIEKPFGSDRASSDQMVRDMGAVLREDQIYRIDHYLGKEVVQNLMVIRYANLIFQAIWHQLYIEHVQVTWKEPQGIGQRAGYFDTYGIIRDVIQNHLFQITALLAMERPAEFAADAVRAEKVRLLRSIPVLTRADLVLGQYQARPGQEQQCPAYVNEPQVGKNSRTPTYAAVAIRIQNERWQGVPFLIRAGKALDKHVTEIRVRFRDVPFNVFCRTVKCIPANELVIRIQPDAAIDLKVISKVPGLAMTLDERALKLHYATAFTSEMPEAYESLLLDVIRGDPSLFISADELAAAWDIVTPVLHAIEEQAVVPEPYVYGSQGPQGAVKLAAQYGCQWAE